MTSASQASPDSSLSLQFALCKAAAVAPTRTTLAMTDVMRSTLSVPACAQYMTVAGSHRSWKTRSRGRRAPSPVGRAAQRRGEGAAVVCCDDAGTHAGRRGRGFCFLDGGHFLDVVHGVNCGCWKENNTDDGEGCSPKKRKPTLQLFFSPESSKPVICKDRQLLVRSLLHVRQLPQPQKLCGFSHSRSRRQPFAGSSTAICTAGLHTASSFVAPSRSSGQPSREQHS